MKQITVLFMCLQSVFLFGQDFNLEWAGAYSGTKIKQALAVEVDPDGNVFTVGFFEGTADFDPGPGVFNLSTINAQYSTELFITKVDVNGNFVWAKQIGCYNNGTVKGYAITIDTAGSLYIAGIFSKTTDFDPGAGVHDMTGALGTNAFILKLDNNGAFNWVKAINNADSQYRSINHIKLDAIGNIYVMGEFDATVDFDPGAAVYNLVTNGVHDVFAAKYDNTGNFIWAKSVGGSSNDWGNGLAVDSQGNVFVIGYFLATVDFDPGPGVHNESTYGASAFILKLDLNGNFVWVRRLTDSPVNSNQSYAESITVDAQGNVYVSGYFYGTIQMDPNSTATNFTVFGSSTSHDVFIGKWEPDGDLLWGKHIGGTNRMINTGIAVDNFGNVYSSGHFHGTIDFDPGNTVHNLTTAGGFDTYISKLNGNGNFIAAANIGGANTDYCEDLALDAFGIVHLAGYFFGTSDFDPGTGIYNITSVGTTISTADAFTAKFSFSSCTVAGTDVKTACGSYTWIDGNTYYASNNTATHTIAGGGVNGCDSIVTLNLTIKQPTSSAVSASACNSYTWHGTTYTTSGAHTWTGMNAAGCDSTVTLNLTIKQPTTSAVSASACNSYTWHGTTYTTSGVHTWTGMNAAGCDSTVTLNLTIKQPTTSAVSASACNSYTWHGTTYTTSGAHTWTGMNAAGCDSTVTLNLTIKQPTSSSVSASACGQYTWVLNNQTYTTSGVYTHVIPNSNNCDSTITLNLTINDVDATVSVSGINLTANQSGATYQWIDCDNGNTPISGAVSQSFTPSENGNYAVLVTANGCTETSSCISVNSVGIELLETVSWTIYPNPNNGVFTITSSQDLSDTAIEIYSSTGQLVYKTFQFGNEVTINLSEHPDGMYLVRINNYLNYSILITK